MKLDLLQVNPHPLLATQTDTGDKELLREMTH